MQDMNEEMKMTNQIAEHEIARRLKSFDRLLYVVSD